MSKKFINLTSLCLTFTILLSILTASPFSAGAAEEEVVNKDSYGVYRDSDGYRLVALGSRWNVYCQATYDTNITASWYTDPLNGSVAVTGQTDNGQRCSLKAVSLGTCTLNGQVNSTYIFNQIYDFRVENFTEKYHVVKPISEITVADTSLSLKPGQEYQLNYTVSPDGNYARAVSDLTFTSSDEFVAEVDNNGVITANEEGLATITAKVGNITRTCELTVSKSGGSISGGSTTASDSGEITDVHINGTIAEVSLETAKDAVLVVAVYDNTGTEMLFSANTKVQRGDMKAKVAFDTDGMPDDGYLISLYLADSSTLAPLCPVFKRSFYPNDSTSTLSLGAWHSAAINSAGELYMWGYNGNGELGDNTTTERSTPTKIMDNIKSVSLGNRFSAAITKDGELYTWGYNAYGNLGNGSNEDSSVPVKIMDNIKAVSCGFSHAAAIAENGDLYIWGYNGSGALGNGTYDDSYVPIKVMENIKAVSCGGEFTAAITLNGELYTWGQNGDGELGNGTYETSNTPVKIMNNVKAVSCGTFHNAAVTENGDLYTWGDNERGELGDGTTTESSVPIHILSNVKAISCGIHGSGTNYFGSHTAAITENGNLFMWGYNKYGQLGDNSTTNRREPVKILENVKYVDLGKLHSAAVTEDGNLYTWGSNANSQLGYDGGERHIPREITIPGELLSAYDENEMKTVTFTDAQENGEYRVYVIKSSYADDVLGADNLLYVTEASASKYGNLTVNYKPDESYESPVCIAVSLSDGSQIKIGTEPVEPTTETTEPSTEPATEPTTEPTKPTEQQKISGDVDSDGKVNIKDATAIQKSAASIIKLTEHQNKAADVNKDNKVNIKDATAIQKYTAGINTGLDIGKYF